MSENNRLRVGHFVGKLEPRALDSFIKTHMCGDMCFVSKMHRMKGTKTIWLVYMKGIANNVTLDSFGGGE